MRHEDHSPWRDELGAYLLGSLEPRDEADLERHIENCPECRTELRWLRPAIHQLPEAVERVEPAPALRARVIAEVRSDAAENQSLRMGNGLRKHARRRMPAFGLRPIIGFAAAALVVAALAGYALHGTLPGGGGATTIRSGTAPGITASLVRNGDSGSLRLANLYEPPRGEVFQAWVRRGNQVVSARSLFVPNPDGTATAVIPNLSHVNAVMVTAEPRGGSIHPTSQPIASLSVN